VAAVSEDERHSGQYCGRTPALGSFLAVVLLALAALAAVACGSGGREFGAEEFVDEANSHGAGLELGAPLDSSQPDTELYEVTSEGGSGTLTVMSSEESAEAEYARCEDTVSLFCYRAANVALYFEEAQPDALAHVAAALKAMGSD
jgi:hypothetical protein